MAKTTVKKKILDALTMFLAKLKGIFVLNNNVVNNVASTSTTYPLSANMGKYLSDQIHNMEYHKGDVINAFLMSAGYLTTSKKNIYVTLPLAKPLGSDVTTMTITSYNSIEIRQNGKYLVDFDIAQSGLKQCDVECQKKSEGYARLLFTSPSGTTFDGTNNEVVGVFFDGKITLS